MVYTELEQGKQSRRAYSYAGACSTAVALTPLGRVETLPCRVTRHLGFDECEADPLSEDETWITPFAEACGQGPKGTAWIPEASVLAPHWEANRETSPGLSGLAVQQVEGMVRATQQQVAFTDHEVLQELVDLADSGCQVVLPGGLSLAAAKQRLLIQRRQAADDAAAVMGAARHGGFDDSEAEPLSEDDTPGILVAGEGSTWGTPASDEEGTRQGPMGTARSPVDSVLFPRWETERETTPGPSGPAGTGEGTSSEAVDHEGQLPVDLEVLQDLIELAECGAAVCFPAGLNLAEAKRSLMLQRARR